MAPEPETPAGISAEVRRRVRERLRVDLRRHGASDALDDPAVLDAVEAELQRQGKLDEKVFAETRLRRGVYGQRYDNGKRHDGIAERTLAFPERPSKGSDTLWDAPGMQRIKIPYGGMSPEQLEVLADLAEEYSDAILHITTRQDIQLHYVHIEDPDSTMRHIESFLAKQTEAHTGVGRQLAQRRDRDGQIDFFQPLLRARAR